MPAARPPQRLTFSFEGLAAEGGHLRLGAFIGLLDSVKATLTSMQSSVGARGDTAFRVVGLSHNSPYTFVLEEHVIRRPSPMHPVLPRPQVARAFVDTLSSVTKPRKKPRKGHEAAPPPPAVRDTDVLDRLEQMADEVHRSGTRMVVHSAGRRSITVDASFREQLDEVLGEDMVDNGSISGQLEKLNLHQARRFDIFPVIGPRRVTCDFPEGLRGQAIAAIDRYVTVYGELRYRSWSPHPHRIKVDSIEIHPPAASLEPVAALLGIAPAATGEKTSEQFVRELRDEW
jgi:hypothetical protein